jgi:hypothetical protein
VLAGRHPQGGDAGGQVLLDDPLRQVDVVDALLLEPDQDAAFDLDEADLAAGPVELCELLVRDTHEPGVNDIEPLPALGLAPVNEAAQALRLPRLDPPPDGVRGDAVLADLAGQEAADPNPVHAVLEGQLAGHGLDPFGQAGAEPLTEGEERLALPGHQWVPVTVGREDLEDDLKLDDGIGAGLGRQAVPPRLQRPVDCVDTVLTDAGKAQVIPADEMVLAEGVLDGRAVATDLHDHRGAESHQHAGPDVQVHGPAHDGVPDAASTRIAVARVSGRSRSQAMRPSQMPCHIADTRWPPPASKARTPPMVRSPSSSWPSVCNDPAYQGIGRRNPWSHMRLTRRTPDMPEKTS